MSERPAVAVGSSVVWSYGEVAERVARLAAAMRSTFNLKPGDRVGLILKNCPEYLELKYACWHAGLVAVPINAKLHSSEFQFILENSGTSICFATKDLSGVVGSLSLPQKMPVIEVGSAEYEKLVRAQPMAQEYRAPDDPAWLFYTSGTTGRPKGATLSHRNLMAMIWCYFADIDQGAPWNAILHPAPISHGSGCYGLPHVTQGSCYVIPESGGFEPGEIFEIIKAWPHCSMFAAPTMVKRLIDHPADVDTENLKAIIYGGGPMYLEDCQTAIKRFGPKLGQLYGQGESPMCITGLSVAAHGDFDHPRYLERLASAGLAQSAVDVRVIDNDGNELPAGEIGEITVRGDAVMLGYWDNPEATADAMRDGWLSTGDVGSFDEDGYLTLKDRSKDMIISGGTNIYPREIEEVLLRHPDVSEISVIGTPDREWGEAVVAYVVGRGNSLGQDELNEFCLEHMARFKRPKTWRFVDELPKNNYGKVLKRELREREEAATEKT